MKTLSACQDLPDNPALLLSGGLDSGGLLAACVAAGKRPMLFTAHLGEYQSADNRAAFARAQEYGLPIQEIAVPRNEEYATRIMRWVIESSGGVVKTAIETLVILRFVLDYVAERGFEVVLTGMHSGTLWGTSRESIFAYWRGGDEGWTQHRKDNEWWEVYGYPPNATRVSRWYCSQIGLRWCDPLVDLKEWMLARSFAELNSPKHKALYVKAYPQLANTPVTSGGMQVLGGVREYMDMLAKGRNFTSAVAWYNQTARGFGFSPRGDDRMKETWKTR